jgi:hypothetical protein
MAFRSRPSIGVSLFSPVLWCLEGLSLHVDYSSVHFRALFGGSSSATQLGSPVTGSHWTPPSLFVVIFIGRKIMA